jgi:Fe-S cluster biosynthesis and repair protein YggX
MYFIEGVPFTFDTIEKKDLDDLWINAEAALNNEYTLDQVDDCSSYLIEEECHPFLFEVEIMNPELLPDDTLS